MTITRQPVDDLLAELDHITEDASGDEEQPVLNVAETARGVTDGNAEGSDRAIDTPAIRLSQVWLEDFKARKSEDADALYAQRRKEDARKSRDLYARTKMLLLGEPVRQYRAHEYPPAPPGETKGERLRREHKYRQRLYRGIDPNLARERADLSGMNAEEKHVWKQRQARIRKRIQRLCDMGVPKDEARRRAEEHEAARDV